MTHIYQKVKFLLEALKRIWTCTPLTLVLLSREQLFHLRLLCSVEKVNHLLSVFRY